MPPAPSPEDANPRPSPFGGGMTRRRAGREEWHVHPDLAAEFIGPCGLRLREWIADGVTAVVKTGPHRTVYRLVLPSGVYYLKHYKLAGPRAWFQNNLRPCRAYREAAASARVRAAGIATADPVAVGRATTGPFSRDSYFVTREIPNVAPLDESLGERGAPAPRVSSSTRHALAEQLALLTANLHNSGLFHADYHAGNVLVLRDGENVRLSLIDLHPLRPARMADRRRHAMLGMLAASLAPHATRADRRRFFATYTAARGAAEDVRAVESTCAAEVRLRQGRADRKWRRGNRRVLILDADGIACRGLAELGRDTLLRLRDGVLTRDRAATVRERSTSIGDRREPLPDRRGHEIRLLAPNHPARDAWETGHALHRRGFHVPRPLLFASGRTTCALVTEPSPRCTPLVEHLGEWGTSAPWSDRVTTLAALGRLLRRLHDAGFDPAPEAFAVREDGSFLLSHVEYVAQRGMTSRRRRDAVARLLAALPTEKDRIRLLAHYGTDRGFDRAVWSRLRALSSPPSSSLRRTAAAFLFAVAATFSLAALAGCRSLDKPPQAVSLPAKHSVRDKHLLLVSDFKLPKDDPLVADLAALREDVTATLQLPEPRQDVTVYLFSNEEAYRKYLDAVHPGLPPRRAYFVGTKSELAVYTYWGDRVLEDLRHEYTHGILHASLATVPLWLDEGLAEYFEVPGQTPGAMNGDYPHQLAVAVSRGWRPDIDRLENLEEFSQMKRIDYQESWAWVHYLLHASPDTRVALIDYLGDLRDAPHPPALAARVAEVEPSYPARFLGYVATLNSTGGAVIRAATAEF